MKIYKMEAVIYLPMESEEKWEDAEERALDLIEGAGMTVVAWSNTEVIYEEGGNLKCRRTSKDC